LTQAESVMLLLGILDLRIDLIHYVYLSRI